MFGPIAVVFGYNLARTLVKITRFKCFHGDTAFNRADIDTKVTGDTFVIHHLEHTV